MVVSYRLVRFNFLGRSDQAHIQSLTMIRHHIDIGLSSKKGPLEVRDSLVSANVSVDRVSFFNW